MGCGCSKRARRGIKGNTVGPRTLGTNPRQPSLSALRSLALQKERENSAGSAKELAQRANLEKLKKQAIQRKLGHL